jgi:hypothetical protein
MNIRELVHFLQIVLITHYFICKRDNDERKCGLQKKRFNLQRSYLSISMIHPSY